MATWDDVSRIALALPEVTASTSYDNPSWAVRKKSFAWERALRGTDVAALTKLGAEIPEDPILAVRVEHVGIKDVLIGDDPAVFFTIPHFDGYPAVLLRLDAIAADELAELLADGWLAVAPKRLAQAYLDGPGG